MKTIWQAVKLYFKRLDKVLLLLCLTATAFSCTILYSEYKGGFIEFSSLKMQVIAGAAGICAMAVMALISYRFLAKLWFLHLPATLFLVLLTFTNLPIVYTPPGGSDDYAWLQFGGLTLQPSELLKISFILTFALHLSKVRDRMHNILHILLLCLHGAIPCLLIFKQGDMGTALVFFFIFLCMIFSAGLPWRYIIVGAVGITALVPLLWTSDLIPGYLKNRFLVLQDIEGSTLDEAYHQQIGRRVLGSGQLFGKGLFSEKLVWGPAFHNDFILAYIGEALGFVGCAAVVLLLIAICVKLLLVARMSSDPLGCYICVGIFAMFFFQIVINVGMVLGVSPVIGITLPFTSAGGTSLLTSFLAMGLTMSVYAYNRKRP